MILKSFVAVLLTRILWSCQQLLLYWCLKVVKILRNVENRLKGYMRNYSMIHLSISIEGQVDQLIKVIGYSFEKSKSLNFSLVVLPLPGESLMLLQSMTNMAKSMVYNLNSRSLPQIQCFSLVRFSVTWLKLILGRLLHICIDGFFLGSSSNFWTGRLCWTNISRYKIVGKNKCVKGSGLKWQHWKVLVLVPAVQVESLITFVLFTFPFVYFYWKRKTISVHFYSFHSNHIYLFIFSFPRKQQMQRTCLKCTLAGRPIYDWLFISNYHFPYILGVVTI